MHGGRPQAHRSGKQLQVGAAKRQLASKVLPIETHLCSAPPSEPRGRRRPTLIPLGATPSSRSFSDGGARCTESSHSSTWRATRGERTHPAPTVRPAWKELRSTRACWRSRSLPLCFPLLSPFSPYTFSSVFFFPPPSPPLPPYITATLWTWSTLLKTTRHH